MPRRDAPSILLVEDNEAHAHLTQFFLEEQPLAVRVDRAQDGEEALAYLAASARPALVLLDLRLPRLDGLEVLRHIKTSNRLSAIPVVVLSTSESETDVAAAYALHANGYLTKPMDPVQYARMIEALITYWLEWNHPPERPFSLGVAASPR